MRVLVDFDGVCARTADFVCAVFTASGYPLTSKDLHDWDWMKGNPEHERLFQSAYDVLDALPHVRASLEPYDNDTAAALGVLSNRYEVDIVTANEARAAPGIHAWLERQGIGDRDIFVRCVGREFPDKTSLGYQVIIDDNPGLAAKCSVVRRWRDWPDCLRLVRLAELAWLDGRLTGPFLALANTRWNTHIENKGEL